MIRFLLCLGLFFRALAAPAQDRLDFLLDQIEKNNPTLQALAVQRDAGKIGARIGLLPENPEVEFGFLGGSPASLGRRFDISVRQTFDFPSAYVYKARIAETASGQWDRQWEKERRALRLEARLLALDLIYANALQRELEARRTNAREVAGAIEAKFEKGDANILELNKVKLALLDIEKDVEVNEMERRSLLADLSRLNGGQPVSLPEDRFETADLPENFGTWITRAEQNNPELQWLRGEVEHLEIQVKLDKALSLPKFSLGYMSESVEGESYHGLTAGISLPLFERKHTVRHAERSAEAMRSLEADGKRQFMDRMRILYDQVRARAESARGYRAGLPGLDNTPLLKKALDSGEISVIEYVYELTMYYDSMNRLLQMERDLHRDLARLKQFDGQDTPSRPDTLPGGGGRH